VTDEYVLPVDGSVLSVSPHAHYLAKRMEGFAVLPDGTRKELILIKDWGFMAMCLSAFMTYIGRFGLLTWTPLYWAETAGIKLKDVPVMTFALPLGMIALFFGFLGWFWSNSVEHRPPYAPLEDNPVYDDPADYKPAEAAV